ncbi:DUF4232 domain-containing protein [Streptomyces minutiscleroticus]|uniref:DUF4232 domain-containing protein n=1 Tax=Streptomyces minutiscleroticus TaxID=68238 RepID=UPI00331F600D
MLTANGEGRDEDFEDRGHGRGHGDGAGGNGPGERRGRVCGRRARDRRRLALAAPAAVLAGAMLLAGCGGGDGPQKVRGDSSPVGEGTAATSPSAGDGSATPSAGSGDASKSSGPSGAPTGGEPKDDASKPAQDGDGTGQAQGTRCHTGELKASVGGNDPGAGQKNFPLVLTNTSGRTCTVDGYPGLAFVDGAGRQVSVDPERADGSGEGAVKLAPGESAWAPLSFTNPDTSGAERVTPASVLITPPDERDHLTVKWEGGAVPKDDEIAGPRVGRFSAGSGA